jgi:Tol biopolymer transport system component
MVRRLEMLPLLAGAVVFALLLLPAASAGPGTTSRVSVAGTGLQANGHSVAAAISADGRFVAFYSDASNLVDGDTNGARDVFIRDSQGGTTTRVSVDAAGAQANSHSFAPAISADGRFVAFHSAASNLVPADTNASDDVFVRDRQTGATERVSLSSAGVEAGGGSFSPALSADGRYVAFLSDASNLVAGDTNGFRDVFVHDRQTRATMRVSVDSAGVQADVGSYSVAISGDGRFVAFHSFADNLVPDDLNETADVFVHDRQTSATTRVSVYDGGAETDGDSFRPAISADGRFVAFDSDSTILVWGDVNFVSDVFVHDRLTDTTRRVSVDDGGGEATGVSQTPSISADGRYVAFYSEASDLVAGDSNGSSDIFVHDRQSGATTRVSVANGGEQGNGDSLRPVLNADGHLVVFESDSSNLVVGDTNNRTDIFAHDPSAVAPPPPPPPVRCVVPRVIGLRLAVARKRIGRANCLVGRVRRARSRKVGKVLSQSPKAGSVRTRGAKVNLVVGRR